ncbi:Hypothetical protein DHA2_150905 [Giardia duodenalis]|uniref:Uncharacterized protein n=1 Tax=Giardia intestinalis TaxID=5741 RepID=V6TKC1_GIAIN|nr:Hypothetical protein DHA2_150905 [Giardia intestinalis]
MRLGSYSSAKAWGNRHQSTIGERNQTINEVVIATKGLLNRSNQLIHTSHNITVNSKSTAEKTLAALTVAHKQLEHTKQCLDSGALTPKALQRASASIVQRVGRSEPCIDAFQRIFPPEEIGGAIVWSPNAAARNIQTALPYKIRHQSRLYDYSTKQSSEGSPSRTSIQLYNTYTSRVPLRSAASSNKQLINLHQNMAQKAVLDHVEINRSLIGHLVEAKEEVRRDLSQHGEYCDYYAAQEMASEDRALVCNPVRRLDQLDHIVNNITNHDVVSFINDGNANAIFQNAVVAESAKALSPIRSKPYHRSSSNTFTSKAERGVKAGATPQMTPQCFDVNANRIRSPASMTYVTKRGRTEAFADSLARAFESPKRKSSPAEYATDEPNSQMGASQMLLSTIAGYSGNPLDDAFQLRSSAADNLDPELLAFNYAAQHIKTAAEKYYSVQPGPPSHVTEYQSQSNISSQQSHDVQPEPLQSDRIVDDDTPVCEKPEDNSDSSTEGFQIVPSKSMDTLLLTPTLSSMESLTQGRQLTQQSKSADSLVKRTISSIQKRPSVKQQQGKNTQVHREGERTKRTAKTSKKRPTTKQQKVPKEAGAHQRKASLTRPHQQIPMSPVPNKNIDSEESTASIVSQQPITVLAKTNPKTPIGTMASLSQQQKKGVRILTLNISSTSGTNTNTKISRKKNTSLLEEMVNNNVISQSRHSLEMRVAHTAAQELLLPSTFSLSSTPGSSPAASRVVKAALTPPLPSPGTKGVPHEPPESMRLSIIEQSSSPLGQAGESSLYPVRISSLDSKTKNINGMLIAQKNLANRTTESTSVSQSSSVADRMRALTPDQRKHRLNSILERRSSATRASIDSMNRLSLDMQIRGSIDAQYSDYTDTRRETSVLSDQDPLFPRSRRGSISRSRHVTERLSAAIGAREERRSLDEFVDETEDVEVQDAFVQRDQILRTLKLDTKTRKTLRKIRAFLLLALIGNALMSRNTDHTPRGSPRNRRYNFKQMYNRHRNLTHALDYDANIPAMKIRK